MASEPTCWRSDLRRGRWFKLLYLFWRPFESTSPETSREKESRVSAADWDGTWCLYIWCCVVGDRARSWWVIKWQSKKKKKSKQKTKSLTFPSSGVWAGWRVPFYWMTSSDCIRDWKHRPRAPVFHTKALQQQSPPPRQAPKQWLRWSPRISCEVTRRVCTSASSPVLSFATVNDSLLSVFGFVCGDACLCVYLGWRQQQQKNPFLSRTGSETRAWLLNWDKEFQGNLPFTVRHGEWLPSGDHEHRVLGDVFAVFFMEDLWLFMFGLVFKHNKWCILERYNK